MPDKLGRWRLGPGNPVTDSILAWDVTNRVMRWVNTLSGLTLTAPTIADFSNAAHDHGDADDGGAIVAGAVPTAVKTRAQLVQPHAVAGTGATLAAVADTYGAVQFADSGATQDALWTVAIPTGFTTLTKAVVTVIAATGSGNLRYQVDTNWGASGEDYLGSSDSIAATTLALTNGQITDIDIAAAFTGIAEGDRIGLRFRRLGADGLDTIPVLYVLGLLLEYS